VHDLLVVEDKASLRAMLRKTLVGAGYRVDEAATGSDAVARLAQRRYLAVLCDLKLPGADGFEVLRAALDADPSVPVVLMTAYGTIEDAVRAMKAGAFDFLPKPVDTDHLLILVERALAQRRLRLENLLLKETFAERLGLPEIIGESAAIREAGQKLQKVAGTEATVLLLGESGTGKELFARALHELSPRRSAPFVPLNCAAIPEALLENELFGHERGAYTGADQARIGKLELAAGGTVFLDEIGELPLAMQGKLLRVLQERCFERVGGNATLDADVRVVAASNRDLEATSLRGEFRRDLYFRLSVFPLTVPPLRERREDIPLLATRFLERVGRDLHRGPLTLNAEAMAALRRYPWPGNVRELRNGIERAAILCETGTIGPEHLQLAPVEDDDPSLRALVSQGGSLAEVAARAAAAAERLRIRDALRAAGGDRARAAEALQISARTLAARLRDLQLEAADTGVGSP
jgi:DNA-binding NtrC family response regulator